MSFRVPYIMVADGVIEMPHNKIQVVGIFDQMFISEEKLPTKYPSFVIVAFAVGEHDDDLGQHRIVFRVQSPSRQQTWEMGTDVTFTPRGGTWLTSLRFVIQVKGLPIREHGRHRVVLLIDGREVSDTPILVTNPPSEGRGSSRS